jgi:hypothetical protein
MQVRLSHSQSTYPTWGRTSHQQLGGPVRHFNSSYNGKQFFLLYSSTSAIHRYVDRQFFHIVI